MGSEMIIRDSAWRIGHEIAADLDKGSPGLLSWYFGRFVHVPPTSNHSSFAFVHSATPPSPSPGMTINITISVSKPEPGQRCGVEYERAWPLALIPL